MNTGTCWSGHTFKLKYKAFSVDAARILGLPLPTSASWVGAPGSTMARGALPVLGSSNCWDPYTKSTRKVPLALATKPTSKLESTRRESVNGNRDTELPLAAMELGVTARRRTLVLRKAAASTALPNESRRVIENWAGAGAAYAVANPAMKDSPKSGWAGWTFTRNQPIRYPLCTGPRAGRYTEADTLNIPEREIRTGAVSVPSPC